jgi:hypothetical protein
MATDDDESAFAAMNCLDSISASLSALSGEEEEDEEEDDGKNAHLIRAMEPYCMPLIAWVLGSSNDSGIEYLENALTLLALFSFYGPEGPFSDAMWVSVYFKNI